MNGPNDGGSCIGVRKLEGSVNEPLSILRLLIKSSTFVTLASITFIISSLEVGYTCSDNIWIAGRIIVDCAISNVSVCRGIPHDTRFFATDGSSSIFAWMLASSFWLDAFAVSRGGYCSLRLYRKVISSFANSLLSRESSFSANKPSLFSCRP